jgi:hypothetical protein
MNHRKLRIQKLPCWLIDRTDLWQSLVTRGSRAVEMYPMKGADDRLDACCLHCITVAAHCQPARLANRGKQKCPRHMQTGPLRFMDRTPEPV